MSCVFYWNAVPGDYKTSANLIDSYNDAWYTVWSEANKQVVYKQISGEHTGWTNDSAWGTSYQVKYADSCLELTSTHYPYAYLQGYSSNWTNILVTRNDMISKNFHYVWSKNDDNLKGSGYLTIIETYPRGASTDGHFDSSMANDDAEEKTLTHFKFDFNVTAHIKKCSNFYVKNQTGLSDSITFTPSWIKYNSNGSSYYESADSITVSNGQTSDMRYVPSYCVIRLSHARGSSNYSCYANLMYDGKCISSVKISPNATTAYDVDLGAKGVQPGKDIYLVYSSSKPIMYLGDDSKRSSDCDLGHIFEAAGTVIVFNSSYVNRNHNYSSADGTYSGVVESQRDSSAKTVYNALKYDFMHIQHDSYLDYSNTKPVLQGSWKTTDSGVKNYITNNGFHYIWSADDTKICKLSTLAYVEGYPISVMNQGDRGNYDDCSLTAGFFNSSNDIEKTLQMTVSDNFQPEEVVKKCCPCNFINKSSSSLTINSTYVTGSFSKACTAFTIASDRTKTVKRYIPTYCMSNVTITNPSSTAMKVHLFDKNNHDEVKTLAANSTLTWVITPSAWNIEPNGDIYLVVTDSTDVDDDFYRAYYITGAGKYVSELMSDSGYCDLYFMQGTSYIFTKFEGNGWKPSNYCWSPNPLMMSKSFYVSDNANVGLALKTNKTGTGLAYVKSNFYATKPFTKFDDTFSDDYIICPCAFHSATGHMDLFMNSKGTTTPTKIGDYNPENGNNTMTGQFTYGVCVPCYKASNECDSNITVNMYGWDLPNDKEKYALPVGYNTFIEITNNTSSIQKIYSYSGHLLCTINPGEYYTAEFGGDCKTSYDYTFTNVPVNTCYVYSATDNKWHEALAYVYVGGTWKEAVPYVYNGSEWKKTSC